MKHIINEDLARARSTRRRRRHGRNVLITAQ